MIDNNTPLWQLTVGQFIELNESINKPIINGIEEKEEYLTSTEAIAYLKISKSTLERWKKKMYLPFERKGGIVRFKKSELDRVLTN